MTFPTIYVVSYYTSPSNQVLVCFDNYAAAKNFEQHAKDSGYEPEFREQRLFKNSDDWAI